MPGAIILNEDWSEYDKRKMANSEEVHLFNCKEGWEATYLFNVLQKRFDFLLSETTVLKAIDSTCKEMDEPVSREYFLDEVMLKLIS
jgi:hypothetical protein